MGIFGGSKKEKLVAVFDIGSGSVGGALAHIPEDGNLLPEIITSARTEIAFQENLDFATFTEDMIGALKETAKTIYNSRLGAPKEIVCVLASPWYLSETRLVKTERTTHFVFNKRIADELLQNEITALDKEYKKKYSDTDSLPEMIESKTLSVMLNGYPIDNPMGVKAKSVEMNIIVSLSPKLCLDKIRETLSGTFHHTPILFESFVTASYLAVRDKYISPDSYLLIDIGGEITDVSIVSKGILKASLSFPFGRQALFRMIMKNMNVDVREAQSVFSLYASNTLEEGRKEKFSSVLEEIKKSWNSAFRVALDSLPRTLTLPSAIFLTADSDVTTWFSNILECEEYLKSLSSDKKCTVVTMKGPEFLDMCKVKSGGCDPFLMIEAISVMRQNK